MLTTALALLILAGVALYLMTPEERLRLRRLAIAAARRALKAALERSPSEAPLETFLRARTRVPIATPAIVALNVVIFAGVLLEPGAASDPQTLASWGGNAAPRTMDGEWWRLVTATFVHAGLLHLLASTAGLVPLGLMLERAVGSTAFAATYLGAGVLAGVVSLWTASPLTVNVGASGAVCGIYGLLLASVAWGALDRPPVPVPLITAKRVAAAAAVFLPYSIATDHLGAASELASLAAGVAGGLVLARGIGQEKPAARRAAAVVAATTLLAVLGAVPLRGIVDVRPDLARIASVEQSTVDAYDAAVAKFRHRRIEAEDLVQLIDRTIIPDLLTARAQLDALRAVPREQAPLVAAAEEYFELREASWRLRAEGLLESSMATLRKAEETERAALRAFERMQPAS